MNKSMVDIMCINLTNYESVNFTALSFVLFRVFIIIY